MGRDYKLYLKSKGSSFEKIKDDKEINSLYKKMLLKEKIEIISPKITPYDIARKSDLAISFLTVKTFFSGTPIELPKFLNRDEKGLSVNIS